MRPRTLTLFALASLACAITSAQQPGSQALPEAEGKAVVERACAQCHSLETVTRARLTRKQWEAQVDQMISRGAKLSDDDIDVVVDYLAKYFGPGGTK